MTDEERLILLVILIVVAIITFFIEIRYIRGKKLRKTFSENRIKKDQAFNALHTTRAVRNKLREDRIDTVKADYLLQKAQDALEANDYDSCISTCAKIREELLMNKRQGNVLAEPSGNSEVEAVLAATESSRPTSESNPSGARKLKIPSQGRDDLLLQARFELNAAKSDLDSYSGSSSTSSSAGDLVREAEKHFNEKDYQRSLSCSFKARKLMSGEPTEQIEVPKKSADVEIIPPASTSKVKCNECGSEIEEGDSFCAVCGNRVGEKKCISCGASMKGKDVFCRKCGAKN